MATVVIENRGADPIEFVHPAVTTNIDLQTNDGRRLKVVRTGPSLYSHTPLPHLKLAPGEEDRFVVTVREIYDMPEAAADAGPRPETTRDLPEIDTMGSDDSPNTNGPASREPAPVMALAPGRYRLRLQIVLASPHDPNTRRSIRLLSTDPVTVSYRPE